MIKFNTALCGTRQGDGVGRGRNARLFMKQIGQTLGGTRTAQQIAIHLAQGGKGARQKPTGQHKGNNGAPGQSLGLHVQRALPHHHGDGAKHHEDQHSGQDGARADATFRSAKGTFHRAGKPLPLTFFLTKGLDDLHRAQRFIDNDAHIGHAILALARHIAQATADDEDGAKHQRNAHQQHRGQLWRYGEQIDDRPDGQDKVAQRNRGCRANRLFDQRRIRGQARRDFCRAVHLKIAG